MSSERDEQVKRDLIRRMQQDQERRRHVERPPLKPPLISRNYAIFLTALASIVLATPFVERDDWLGWAASVVSITATVTILAQLLAALVRTVKEWRDGELD